jgi:5,10-methylenetetrahydrofolate reductase
MAITGYLFVDLGANFIFTQIFYKLFEMFVEEKKLS